MRTFPLAKKVDSYITNASCKFNAPRDEGRRKHGGCDLGAPVGTPVYAVDAGEVVEVAGGFLDGTSVVSIAHGDVYDDDYIIVRYGEVDTILVQLGQKVEQGQMIAKVGKQSGGTQLHLEIYAGDQTGQFLQENSRPYKRRSDIKDPTPYLDAWPEKS